MTLLIAQNELQTDVTFTLSWVFYKNLTFCLWVLFVFWFYVISVATVLILEHFYFSDPKSSPGLFLYAQFKYRNRIAVIKLLYAFSLNCLSFCIDHQVSARPSCPKRNVRRGGKSWRRSGRSAKLLKVLSNWAHANWTDGDEKKDLSGMEAQHSLSTGPERSVSEENTVNSLYHGFDGERKVLLFLSR